MSRQFHKPQSSINGTSQFTNDVKKTNKQLNRASPFQVKPPTQQPKQVVDKVVPLPPSPPSPLVQDLVAFKSIHDTALTTLSSLRVCNNQLIAYGRLHICSLSSFQNENNHVTRAVLFQMELLLRGYIEELQDQYNQITQKIYELQEEITRFYTPQQPINAAFYTSPFMQQYMEQQQQQQRDQ